MQAECGGCNAGSSCWSGADDWPGAGRDGRATRAPAHPPLPPTLPPPPDFVDANQVGALHSSPTWVAIWGKKSRVLAGSISACAIAEMSPNELDPSKMCSQSSAERLNAASQETGPQRLVASLPSDALAAPLSSPLRLVQVQVFECAVGTVGLISDLLSKSWAWQNATSIHASGSDASDCTATEAAPLVLYHSADGGWHYTSASGRCLRISGTLACRLDALCQRNGGPVTEAWPTCLEGSLTGFEAEPVGHSWATRRGASGSIDPNCRDARQRAIYGEGFVPNPSDEPVHVPRSGPAAGLATPAPSHDDRRSTAARSIADSQGAPPGHLEPFGRQGQRRVRMEQIEGCLSVPELLTRFAYAHRPVVMRGCANGSASLNRWSDAYLAEQAGDWVGHPHLEDLQMSTSRFVNANLTPADVFYVTRHGLPAVLRRDVEVPASLRCEALMRHLENLVLWWNAGSQRSDLHFDGGDFFLTQLDGVKEVLLVDPVESLQIYADFPYDSYGHSPINTKRVDVERYPLAARVTLHEAALSPGDTLFIPKHWWHVIHSLPGARNLAYTLQFNLPPPEHTLGRAVILESSKFSYYLVQHALAWRAHATPPEWRTPLDRLPRQLHDCVRSSDTPFPRQDSEEVGQGSREGVDPFSLEMHPALVRAETSGTGMVIGK